MIPWLTIALCTAAVLGLLIRGRRRRGPTAAQLQLGKVIDFPQRRDRIEFRSCRSDLGRTDRKP